MTESSDEEMVDGISSSPSENGMTNGRAKSENLRLQLKMRSGARAGTSRK